MEIKENDYIIGVWHAANSKVDFMMIVKASDDSKWNWEFEQRFRYIKDDKVFESKDVKHIKGGYIKDQSEEEVILKMGIMMELLKTSGLSSQNCFVEVKGGGEKFVFKLAQQPWCYIRTVHKK